MTKRNNLNYTIMNMSDLTNEDKVFIRTIFNEMRKSIQNFITERDFNLSNAQLFAFLSNSPAALAIASDGAVDEKEIAGIEKLSKGIDIGSSVNLDLMEMMAVAFEPDNCITNEEFNIRVGSEILFLAKNFKKYESEFVNALKAMLTFDMNPKRDGSLSSSFSKLMDTMIENNVSKDKEAEMKKMKELKMKIGI